MHGTSITTPSSRVKGEDLCIPERLSFNSSKDTHSHKRPKLPLSKRPSPNTRLKIVPSKPLLNANTRLNEGTADSTYGTKKLRLMDKENINDSAKCMAQKKNDPTTSTKTVLSFSNTKSNKRPKTLSSNQKNQQEMLPLHRVSCFESAFDTSYFTIDVQGRSLKDHSLKDHSLKDHSLKDQSPSNPSPTLNDFCLSRKLGKGKFGNVFLAVHKPTNFICAIKVISKSMVVKQGHVNQICQQIKLQSLIAHSNITSLYGFFEEGTNLYLILEYCSDGDLYSLMKNRGVLPEKQAANILKQTLQGLTHLHRKSIFHRDMKPENILIVQGVVKISDFGWARISNENGLRKTLCGTPLYLSPEIMKGEEYDERVDIWALGILAYEMLLGSNPFQIRKRSELSRIVDGKLEFPEGSGLSVEARDFVERTLQKDIHFRMDGEQLLLHPFVKHQ